MPDQARLRFFGPHLVAIDGSAVRVHDATGKVRFVTEVPGVLDVAAVHDELWTATPGAIKRLSARDGRELGTLDTELDPDGRTLVSATAPQLPIWHCARPRALAPRVQAPSGELVLPLAETRWLVWQAGQPRLWRPVGEVWRRPIGEPGGAARDGQLILDGRLFVLDLQRGDERRLVVVALSDGVVATQLRVPEQAAITFAAHRGIAMVATEDRFVVIDLRFGRVLREVARPLGMVAFAVDDSFQRLAVVDSNGLRVIHPDALAATETDAITATEPVSPTSAAPEPTPEPVAAQGEPLPAEPLVRLDPIQSTRATPSADSAAALDHHLQLVAARAEVAITDAWDTGRLARPDPTKLPFADELAGLLRLGTGRASAEVARATARLRALEDSTRPLATLDALARDFELSPLAQALLLAIAAPRLRGELARIFGILANDPARPVVDQMLLSQMYGAGVSEELDGARPLRKLGLVHVGVGERPFAALSVDPLVVRLLAGQPVDGEPDPHVTVRRGDRSLAGLHIPRQPIAKALRFLATARPDPVRLVVRGRTGSGRHTLLAALAARAGRDLGVIDLASTPPDAVEGALRRARLRGLVPCLDGLEIPRDERDTNLALVLRDHPGPLAIRLPPEAPIPLDPGYLLVDIPARDERGRAESWRVALDRHHIPLPDPSELAARYRVGPGVIERVCIEVSQRPDAPTTPIAWMDELDGTVRQHLENRLGSTANRVSRLATWADVVLPEDVVDSLVELTARVRHRKTVYETWGFDRSITTARGITALFQGSPGTGKTMVAGVLARDLGLELYRVDVSRITSKWIGETEKNLGALFDAAEDGQVMLLFDEADSLFAKRTEVKTSVDRYANMEVNYLLQRLDSFEGIAILTTNFGNAIDPAFKRRLTYRVTFPFPDEDMREKIWRALFPPRAPIQGTIDFAKLAQRFRLSGGYIRNAALRSAFLAAEEGSAITHELVERAIRAEFREIGKLSESGALE